MWLNFFVYGIRGSKRQCLAANLLAKGFWFASRQMNVSLLRVNEKTFQCTRRESKREWGILYFKIFPDSPLSTKLEFPLEDLPTCVGYVLPLICFFEASSKYLHRFGFESL